MRFFLVLTIALTLLFILSPSAFAVTTAIIEPPTTIISDPFALKISIAGAAAGSNYLRIDLFKPSTSNYFGETYNGTGWYSESDFNQYFPLIIEAGVNWFGEIQGRIGNPTSAQYDGPGPYKLRIRRYTPSGNYNSAEANNNVTDVIINIVIPTIAYTPNQLPSDTPTPGESEEQPLSPTVTITQQTISNIFLSEVMPDPDSGQQEWIEIYNKNSVPVVLDEWWIDDLEKSGSTPKKFTLSLDSGSYAVFELSTSVFNNGGDSVRLLDSEQNEVDSFEYQASEKGKTLGRTSFDSDIFCQQSPTYAAENGPCLTQPATSNNILASATPVGAGTRTPTAAAAEIQSIISPVKFSSIKQAQQPNKAIDLATNNQVLGEKTDINANKASRVGALVSSLSFAAFFYSILSISSIIFKLKMVS
ncbi:hypothetical protein A2774_03530 [Candidatus Roizmanbacteria bacterium RIFCSPHIGHO2_01_FULL_39_12c]|uniref:LTD domain-containing protein n=1 Tax=Candidatus Roizmanbacteria bacterium RIFCSPHIGHO2_01_FULL_39_12c TaxID=1802031 RepID=A0A1F7G8X4_9BACT|nr:MAG: hypothetical protein A2774_03530 [Candidatus Roizmanbacteria bacterium RIFCSPHIGHO2_01_FULL_39_12c]OGK47827.1 MAG: hypothetical protein A2963_03165 [Candidatus Roizmanbacteria bacterium RIFCSPLOWO2_01_FULL_40_13]